MGIRLSSALVSAAVLASALITPAFAQADIQHTVAKGHTIEAIAARYHVSSKAIIEANKLKDVKHLHPGDVLTIPGVNPKPPSPSKAKADHDDAKKDKAGAKDKDSSKAKVAAEEKKPTTYAMKAKTPGVIHLKRIASTEEQDIRVGDKHGKVSDTAAKSVEKLLRSQSGVSHPIDKRLVQLLGVMSNHFGSRKIEVVSGFRPYTPTQYTPHSNHNHGKAVDFRVLGVPNEAVRDFCRTLKDVGCGYYPNSTFVHMDVRANNAFWIDFSKPGEPPRYNAPNVEADEGTSDVQAGASPASNTAPDTSTDSQSTPTTPNAPAAPNTPSETPAAPAAETAPATEPKKD
jgi:uncharacterized protein YcbK (DUF882 family)